MAGLVMIFIDLSLLPIVGDVTIFIDLSPLPMAGDVTIFIHLCPLPYGQSSHDIYRSQSTALWLVKSQYV